MQLVEDMGASYRPMSMHRCDRAGLLTVAARQAYEEPGPFSYLTYLEHILKRDSWGDEITLVVLSMVFQLRITVVTVPSLHGDPIHHINALDKSDIVLLRSGGNHYLSAGMYALNTMFLVLFYFSFVSPPRQQPLCVCLSGFGFLLVKQTTGKDSDGSSVSCSLPLAVKPLEKSPTYDIADEDPSVYSDEDDFDMGFILWREWKDVPLPCQSPNKRMPLSSISLRLSVLTIFTLLYWPCTE